MKINKNIYRVGYLTVTLFLVGSYFIFNNMEKAYIEEHLTNEVSEADIMDHCPTRTNICKCVLSTSVKELSYKDYQEFKKLLISTDISTNEVQEFVKNHNLSFTHCL